MKNKKITASALLGIREMVIDRTAALKTALEKKHYHPAYKAYIKDHSPVKKGKVYEIGPGSGRKARKGYGRFLITTIRLTFSRLSKAKVFIFMEAGGFWLGIDGTPEKWDSMTVEGVGNPTKFVLSKNQEHGKVTKEIVARNA